MLLRSRHERGPLMHEAQSGRAVFLVLCLACWSAVTTADTGSGEHRAEERRPITVADTIAATRLDLSAQFSPNGKRFVVVLRTGNLENNTNEFSVYLYRTADVFSSPKPDCVLMMASSTNEDAIKDLRWLDDHETLAFVGQNPGKVAQFYTFDLRTRSLTQQTHNTRPVRGFAITGDGRTLLYAAESSPTREWNLEKAQREGVVITPDQDLPDLLKDGEVKGREDELFLKKLDERARQVSLPEPICEIYGRFFMYFSPDGRYALICLRVKNIVPPEWAGYQDHDIQTIVATHLPGVTTGLKEYFLLDITSGSLEPLLNTPMPGPSSVVWAPDSQSLFLRTYLPLNNTDAAERELRAKSQLPVEVKLPSKEIRKLTDDEFKTVITKAHKPPSDLLIRTEEDLNTAPKLYATDPKTKQKALLLDPNPQFSDLAFGNVERIEWKAANGVEAIGGLYLPPDYVQGQRYPLVIQTHGFSDKQFSMDGTGEEWSSAYSARPLAAKGIIVLQMQEWGNESDISAGKFGGNNRGQAFKLASRAAFEGAIDYLDGRGLIDRKRAGIGGFSITVSSVGYTLTHSTYHWAAAILTDGIDDGYFQHLAFPGSAGQSDDDNGGVTPFGPGLQQWLRESPSFSMDKVRTPIRLVAITPPAVLEMWEWFAALNMQHKPVDFILIPDGQHLMAKPWERRTTMQGVVDWYSFWLKGEEDPDPTKADQYKRWREMRKLQEQQQGNSPTD
jgi:dipeptidyl aminopeptidase/acylaminoacyl peptidase